MKCMEVSDSRKWDVHVGIAGRREGELESTCHMQSMLIVCFYVWEVEGRERERKEKEYM